MFDEKYELIRLIGNGTFTSIFQAKHKLKGTTVAIKINNNPNEISTKLMTHETKMYLYLKKNQMKDVVSFKTFGKYKSYHYIIMDYLSFDLKTYIQNNSFEFQKKKNIFESCMYQLKKLHQIDVVHRDIKPDNFMINEKGTIYMIDFGLSCVQNKSYVKNIIGTPLFCSYRLHKTPYIYEYYDDIVSLFYVFFYLYSNGDLPWKNIYNINKNDTTISILKRKTKYEQYYLKYKNRSLNYCINQYNNYIKS